MWKRKKKHRKTLLLWFTWNSNFCCWYVEPFVKYSHAHPFACQLWQLFCCSAAETAWPAQLQVYGLGKHRDPTVGHIIFCPLPLCSLTVAIRSRLKSEVELPLWGKLFISQVAIQFPFNSLTFLCSDLCFYYLVSTVYFNRLPFH